MLPIFHASGHIFHAKCTHLYLQDVDNLKTCLGEEGFKQFTELGYFTIRRSDRYWSGIWSDMTIEQVLMRSLKVHGGLTSGRGVTDSLVTKFVLAMPTLIDIIECFREFSGVSQIRSEQQVEGPVNKD